MRLARLAPLLLLGTTFCACMALSWGGPYQPSASVAPLYDRYVAAVGAALDDAARASDENKGKLPANWRPSDEAHAKAWETLHADPLASRQLASEMRRHCEQIGKQALEINDSSAYNDAYKADTLAVATRCMNQLSLFEALLASDSPAARLEGQK